MSFLTIPSEEGLFTTIKTRKSTEEGERRSTGDDEDNNDEDDEDEDDDTANVRLIPRCSPVPRKRGASIHDETAEYMRIHLALSAIKKVSFADTTGGDLVDVKEFFAFDSDDEEASARWEEEEAKYRKPQREPTYKVLPEFHAPTAAALLKAVHANKVEVEQMSPVENEPLAVSGVIRVLNISFHKAVYIRSTMDSWVSYFDHPAEYVQGSNDGATDQFTFKLSFAPPYMTHGSRIEFVVRYETSDGDFWANNSSMNYVVTLLLSYEDDSAQTNVNETSMKSILKPPKVYSMNDDFDSEDELEKEEAEEAGTSESGLVRPTAVCPVIIQPQIDIEIAVHPSGPSVPPNQELPSVDGTLSAHTVSPGEQFPCMSSETTLQTNSSFVPCASESVQPNKSQPLPRLHCELGNQTSDASPSALLPAATPSRLQELRSDSSEAGRVENPPSEASCTHLSDTEMNTWPATGEDEPTASRPCLELPGEYVSAPRVTQGSEQDAAVGLSELVAGLSKGSTTSSAPHEIAPALLFPESQEEGEAPPSPEPTEKTSLSTGDTEVSQNVTLELGLSEHVAGVSKRPATAAYHETSAPALLFPDSQEAGEAPLLPDLTENVSVSTGDAKASKNVTPQMGLSECVAGLSESFKTPAAREETSIPVLVSSVEESRSEEAPPSPEPTENLSVGAGVPDTSQGLTLQLSFSEFVAGLSESPITSAAHHETSTPALFSPMASEAPPSPELTANPSMNLQLGLRKQGAGSSDGSTTSGARHKGRTTALLFPESQEEGELPPSPELTKKPSVSTDVPEMSQSSALQPVSSREEEGDAPQTETLSENPSDTQSEVSEDDVSRNLMPSVVFLSGVVSLSIVLQQPSALFIIGLLAVLHRL